MGFTGSEGSKGSKGSTGVVRRIKIWKRRNFDSASRASSSRAKSRDLPCRMVSVPIALFQSPLAPNP